MSSVRSRGAFIVIEGLDRSGKTTQVATLQTRLETEGIPVKLFKFPDRTTTIGQMIDSYLRSQSELDDHVIHLLFSANRWELAASIEQLLAAGTTVLCDRYAFSGVAFSTAKGLSLEWCRSPDISLPAPDVTLFLNITPEQARSRGGYGEERYEKEELQRKVRDVFQQISSEFTEATWVTIDAGREREDVAEDVWKIVYPLTGGLAIPLQRLWERTS
ncbi:thymidylate kinase-domain-containing protein [Mycena albidolilacea]|uniref:Thymidylate kinase n=1 Tax=Mycena albidolilacea TaxID=1033008 RepID=A0AAD7A9K4_9AGAR|nr:thymidylate kinase-domain-containing protein [Mycena albidolilacea]